MLHASCLLPFSWLIPLAESTCRILCRLINVSLGLVQPATWSLKVELGSRRSSAQNALWHVSRNAPSPPLFVVGVSCHKKQISCARVAYFPFDFQWFSCSLACFPLLTLAAWPGISAILLRRVVDIYAKHIDSSATRGQMYVCECVCVCACLACSAGCLTPSTALSHPRRAKGNISLYDVIEYLSRTQYNLEVFPTLLGTVLPLDCWRLWCMSCMNQAGHVGKKESSGPSTRICKSIFL